MRRFILLSFIFTVPCWCQGSTALQLDAKPVVVKVEMPPQSFWTRLIEVAIPTVVVACSTLLGVWLTNRRTSTTNVENRKHDLDRISSERSFGLKRDMLIRVTQLNVQTLDTLAAWDRATRDRTFIEYERESSADENEKKEADAEIAKSWAEYLSRRSELNQAIAASCLAISDDLWKSAQSIERAIKSCESHVATARCDRAIEAVREEIKQFAQDARKELGIVRISIRQQG